MGQNGDICLNAMKARDWVQLERLERLLIEVAEEVELPDELLR